MLKQYLTQLFEQAAKDNRANIIKAASNNKSKSLLDLGCDDGSWTLKVATAAQAEDLYAVELIEEQALKAANKSIKVSTTDLAKPLPYANESFDLVHSNQVIEHVSDVDLFAQEIFRVLSPGGTVIVSTENASSWHNIFALMMGWQMFSLTNMSSTKCGIGNPMALLRHQPLQFNTWTHKVIFSYRGLLEFFESHGFIDLTIHGAGYYPLPSLFGKLDPRHSHFITLSGKKPH